MRLIIDQQLPPLLAAWFQSQGVDAVHVRDLGLSDAADTVIWAEAMRDDAVIVSRDEDFTILLRGRGGARLVWIRLGNCSNSQLMARIGQSWPAVSQKLADGERLIEVRG